MDATYLLTRPRYISPDRCGNGQPHILSLPDGSVRYLTDSQAKPLLETATTVSQGIEKIDLVEDIAKRGGDLGALRGGACELYRMGITDLDGIGYTDREEATAACVAEDTAAYVASGGTFPSWAE